MNIRQDFIGALCAALMGNVLAQEPAARQVTLDIQPQPVEEALKTFARQAGVQVLFYSDAVQGITAPRVEGIYTPTAALTQLLAGTSLRYEFINERTVAIRSAQTEGKPIAASPGAPLMLRVAQAGEGTAAAQDKATGGDSAAQSTNKLEEIVVTAQKRSERLVDVPIAISVLEGKDLDRSTDRGVAEALNRVPGVISAYTNGNSRQFSGTGGVVVVRGAAPAIGAGTTGYYLDTIPFGFVDNSIGPDPSAYDLERVEVLRGPQGTLYGVTALNGVVRVLTKDADLNNFELKGRGGISSTAAGGENYRGDLAVNVPLIEGKLAARAVVGYQDWSGWIDKSFKKDVNDTQVGNYRLKINAQPTEKLSASLLAWFSRADVGAPPAGADGRNSVSLMDEPSTADYDAYGLKLGYDLPAFTVTSMTSYIDYQANSAFDYTPFIPAEKVLITNVDTRMFAEEVVLNSTHAGPWRWTFGGMYRNANDKAYQFRSLYPSGPPGTQNGVESKSTAVFGELTRALLDGRFELTGGLRYFEDKKRNWEKSRSSFVNGTIEQPLLPNGSPNPKAGQFGLLPDEPGNYDKLTPRAVLTWHPNAQASLYVSYAEGFRSGMNQFQGTKATFPQFAPAAPDDIKSYEVGAKGSAWGGRLSFDSAVYFLDWAGVQQALTVFVPPLTTFAVVNAESVSGMGAELGVSVEAIEGLTLSTSLNWNDLRVDKDVTTGGLLLYAKGKRINLSPEYTASVSADYAFPLGGSGFKGHFAVSGNYLPQMIADRLQANPAPIVVYTEPVTMVRASFAVESAGRWSASLYGDNLADDKGISRDRFSPRWYTSLRPRTIGIQVEFHY